MLVFFLAPVGLGKILRNSQNFNIRTYYMLNHRIRCIHFILCSFVYLATHKYIPARSYCDTQYLLPLHDYAFFSFKYRFLRSAWEFHFFQFISYRPFANVVRCLIYVVSSSYYSQEATIIVLGKFLYSCILKFMLLSSFQAVYLV